VVPYCTILSRDWDRESVLTQQIEKLTRLCDMGFRAVKVEPMRSTPQTIVDLTRRAREALGPERTLCVDVGCLWNDAGVALSVIERLEEFDVFFFETPFPPEALDAMASILVLDAPRHTKIRNLISKAFTQRRLQTIRDQIAAQSASIVADLAVIESGQADFVEHVSARLPLWTISEMVGVPVELRDEMIHNVLRVNGLLDPEINEGRDPMVVQFEAMTYLLALAADLAEQRRAQPQDDLMTNLVNAEVDGERLTQMEISSFFSLLLIAGNDTTRNTTSVALHALTNHPDQGALLQGDLDRYLPVAIE